MPKSKSNAEGAAARPVRTRRIELKLHPHELEAIQALAAATGHAPAAYLRQLALTQSPPPQMEALRVGPEAQEMFKGLQPIAADLRGLAGNINQLLQHLNQARALGAAPNMQNLATAIKRMIAVEERIDLVRDEVKRLQLVVAGVR